MIGERALVLCRGVAGLEAAAWLASRGVAVRLLCLGALPEPLHWPVAYRGPASLVRPLAGSSRPTPVRRGVWVQGRMAPAPTRKRDLVALSGEAGWWGLGAALFDRRHDGPSARAWGRGRFGATAFDRVLGPWLTQRTGVGARELPAGAARALVGRGDPDGWWRCAEGAARRERWIDAIHEAAGEVLEDVGVEGVELDDGRLVALETEFGRELVEGALVTDLAPGALAALGLPVPAGGDAVDAVEIELEVERPLEVDVLWVLGERPPLVALYAGHDAAGEPTSSVVARMVLPLGHPAAAASDARLGHLARTLVDGIVTPLDAPHRVRRHPGSVAAPRRAEEAAWPERCRAYQRLGIQPVGEVAWQVPHAPGDALRPLALAMEGAVVATQRARLSPSGPPEEPWCLVSEA